MASNKKSVKNFLAMWDNQGLESIFDVDKEIELREQYEKNKIWNVLKEQSTQQYKSTIPLQMMIMRASANSQRHYEIYQFVVDGLTIEDVKDMFDTQPQFMADFIRKNGHKIYSDRLATNKVLIV